MPIRSTRIAYGIAYLFYSITEATFQGMNFLFTFFLALAFTLPKPATASRTATTRLAARPVRWTTGRPALVPRASGR